MCVGCQNRAFAWSMFGYNLHRWLSEILRKSLHALSVRHPGPLQFATRGLYLSADVRVFAAPLTKCDVFKHM